MIEPKYTTIIDLYIRSDCSFPFWVEPWNARHYRGRVKDFGSLQQGIWCTQDPLNHAALGYRNTRFLCDLYSLDNKYRKKKDVYIDAYLTPSWALSDYPVEKKDATLDDIYEEGFRSFYRNEGVLLCPYEKDSDEYWSFERGWTQAIRRSNQ